jgi:hypothetical protein
MAKLLNIFVCMVAVLFGPAAFRIQAQTAALEHGSKAYFDSLDNRIAYLQQQIPG